MAGSSDPAYNKKIEYRPSFFVDDTDGIASAPTITGAKLYDREANLSYVYSGSAWVAEFYPAGATTLRTSSNILIDSGSMLGVKGSDTNVGILYDGNTDGIKLKGSSHGGSWYAGVTEQLRVFNGTLDLGADTDLVWGTAFGTNDTNLYRSSADTLKTDDSFVVGTNLVASNIFANTSNIWLKQADSKGVIVSAGTAGGALSFVDGTPNTYATLDGFAASVLAVGPNGAGLQFTENGTTDLAAGAANTVRLYARDNGAGKTQLVARFNSGAVQVIATEP